MMTDRLHMKMQRVNKSYVYMTSLRVSVIMDELTLGKEVIMIILKYFYNININVNILYINLNKIKTKIIKINLLIN